MRARALATCATSGDFRTLQKRESPIGYWGLSRSTRRALAAYHACLEYAKRNCEETVSFDRSTDRSSQRRRAFMRKRSSKNSKLWSEVFPATSNFSLAIYSSEEARNHVSRRAMYLWHDIHLSVSIGDFRVGSSPRAVAKADCADEVSFRRRRDMPKLK